MNPLVARTARRTALYTVVIALLACVATWVIIGPLAAVTAMVVTCSAAPVGAILAMDFGHRAGDDADDGLGSGDAPDIKE